MTPEVVETLDVLAPLPVEADPPPPPPHPVSPITPAMASDTAVIFCFLVMVHL
jgi:hypothetical protein